MECKKDEAARAKELAENKFREKDITGARTLALKAQSLFASLNGISDLLAALNIYHCAERKVNGEVDWYGVLGVDPSSDDATVRKQYRKLALALHPDKNKSVGADGAFKILSEAWSLLSDKAKRLAYDKKRNSRKIYHKVVPMNPVKTGVGNGFRPSADVGNLNHRTRNCPNPHSTPIVQPKCRNTFWTICTGCKIQFEYPLLYLNKKLQCYKCNASFVAEQIPPPPMNFQPPGSSHRPPVPSYNNTSSTGERTFASMPATRPVGPPGGVGHMGASASSAVKTMNGVHLPSEDKNRMHEGIQVSATMEDAIKSKTNTLKRTNAGETNVASSTPKSEKARKRRRTNEQKVNGVVTEKSDFFAKGSGTFGPGSLSGSKRDIASTRELSLLESRNMLITKAKMEICKKLSEWKNMEPMPKTTNRDSTLKEAEKIPKADGTGMKPLGSKPNLHMRKKDQTQNIKPTLPASSVDSEPQLSDSEPMSMAVPDPDFHDFDKDRNEDAFHDNQVWAAYDNDDGMPRYYAMIHNVISRKPFKMRISWLNSKTNAEFGPMNWVGCGFYKTSGDFRIGQHKINQSVNSFSHQVKWTKGPRGAIRIYPRKGDVWALYRNWSFEWNEHTLDEVIHQYDMVEVLDDYNEEKGVTVISLIKVAGFKTVFKRHADKMQARVIPREEMFRFSHQAPSCLLTGEESPNAPKGCLELDPAAILMELL